MGAEPQTSKDYAVSEEDCAVKDVGVFLAGLIESAYGKADVSYDDGVMSITYNGGRVTKVSHAEEGRVRIEGNPLDEKVVSISRLFDMLAGLCVSYNMEKDLEIIVTSGLIKGQNQ
ncbi:hypothetical protein JW707_01190 [Candidatus Woesearchaeota archaeon]|nr:hypothetical protein [Candidatus Woesearchaeota archaeon]